MKISKPFGTWSSDITAKTASKALIELSDIQSFDGNLYWIEYRPHENGRSVIVTMDKFGAISDMFASPFSHGSKVHEYGGIAYTVLGDYLYFVNSSDQRIYSSDLSNPSGDPKPFTPKNKLRYADLIPDKKHNRIITVCEDHSNPRSIKNFIAGLNIEGSLKINPLITGSDFYAYPRLNKECSKICWIQWNHPNMPWDKTELWSGNNEQNISSKTCIVGKTTSESITQPCWSSNNEIIYISDTSGWWNLYRVNNHHSQQIFDFERDCADPFWQFGMKNFCVDESGFIGYTEILNAEGTLLVVTKSKAAPETVNTKHTVLKSLCIHAGKIILIGSGPLMAQEIFCVDSNLAVKKIYQPNQLEINSEDISIGKSVFFPALNKDKIHAFFYAPKNRKVCGHISELPPAIFLCHGGPTSSAKNNLNFKIQFWTNRGFAVIDLNYRGSSGFGRDYREKLYGKWGEYDIQDIQAAAEYFSDQQMIDKNRCIIRGSSAGGYTVLSALTRLTFFKTGACLYGIGDLQKLATDTHKFESKYLDTLIGDPLNQQEIYQQRSPVNHIDDIDCPVIFLQGLKDKVVPPSQSQSMVDKLIRKNIAVEYVTFKDEGHGFKKPKNIEDALNRELLFYLNVLSLNQQ